jgi:hypothetical protein
MCSAILFRMWNGISDCGPCDLKASLCKYDRWEPNHGLSRSIHGGREAGQFFGHAFATGFAAVAAPNPKFAVRDFSGEIRFIPGAVSDASVQMSIRATSLEIMDDVSASDRAAI